MLVDRLWNAARPFVPVRFYPVLAPLHRWRRRVRIARLADDELQRHRADPGWLPLLRSSATTSSALHYP